VSEPLAVIPSYLSRPEDLEVLLVCLRTLRATTDTDPAFGANPDVLVVDDGSPVPALVDELEGAKSELEFDLIRKGSNTGFSTTVNVGLRRALQEGRDAVLVNADIEFDTKGWLDVMVAQRTSDDTEAASVVGAKLVYPSGLIQHGGIFFSMLDRAFDHIHKYGPDNLPEAQYARRCPVTGALHLIRHECLVSVGIYDETFKLGWEDVDYCLRVFKSGRECVYQPRARAIHHESMFRGRKNEKLQRWQVESWQRWLEKWGQESMGEFVPTLLDWKAA